MPFQSYLFFRESCASHLISLSRAMSSSYPFLCDVRCGLSPRSAPVPRRPSGPQLQLPLRSPPAASSLQPVSMPPRPWRPPPRHGIQRHQRPHRRPKQQPKLAPTSGRSSSPRRSRRPGRSRPQQQPAAELATSGARGGRGRRQPSTARRSSRHPGLGAAGVDGSPLQRVGSSLGKGTPPSPGLATLRLSVGGRGFFFFSSTDGGRGVNDGL
jgi:hypothetical protein